MKMKKWLQILLVVSSFCLVGGNAFACTGVIAGKGVTDDGSIIIGRTEDIGSSYNKNFVVVEAKESKTEEYFEDLNGFKMKLPNAAYKYTIIPDVEAHGDGIYGEAGMNEKGVSMSATVSAGINEAVEKHDPLVENGLREAAMLSTTLPYINTAKEGVEFLGNIVSSYGSAEGNIVLFADQNEAWYMEILSGHQWAAVKVPDDAYAVIPNAFMLGYIDLKDTENVITSKDILDLPKEKGFLKELNGKFHLALTYGETLEEGNRVRAWGGKKFFSPSQKVDYNLVAFELFSKPDKKISLQDVMELQRYRYEGTEYDVNLEKNKDKRPIGIERQAECHIFQMKQDLPKEIGGVMWLAMGNAEHSVYLPSYNIIEDTHDAYKVQGINYNSDSAYWSFRGLCTLAELNRTMLGQGIRDFWKGYESELIKSQKEVEEKLTSLYKEDKAKAAEYATYLNKQITTDALEKANSMYSELMSILAKYPEGNYKEPYKPSI